MTRKSAVAAVFTVVLVACTANGIASDGITEVMLTAANGRQLTVAFPADIDLTSVGVDAEEPVLDSPDVRLDGESGSLLVFIDDCARMSRPDEEVYGREIFAFCDQPTNTLFFVAGSAEIQKRIHETIRVSVER